MTSVAAQEMVGQREAGKGRVSRLFRLARRAVLFFAGGMLISVLMAWALGMWAEPATGVSLTSAAPQRGRLWEVYAWRSSGAMRLYSRRQAQSWTGYQVTGPPDAAMGAD